MLLTSAFYKSYTMLHMLIQCLQCFHMSGHSKDSDCKHNNRIISTNTLLKNKVLSNIPWKDNIKEITLHLCLWNFLKKVKVYVVHFGQICVFILYMTCFPVKVTRNYKPKHFSQLGSLISRPPIQRYPIRKTFIFFSPSFAQVFFQSAWLLLLLSKTISF